MFCKNDGDTKEGKIRSQKLLQGGYVMVMIYPYMTLVDEAEPSHSRLVEKDGIKTVEVCFKRTAEQGLDSARCALHACEWKFKDVFLTVEFCFFEEFLRQSAHLLHRYAVPGGVCAK